MTRRVDVAIIGAGSAGLAALKEVRRRTNDFVVIDDGALGTTCARVGCMPSKALIQVANEYHARLQLASRGIRAGEKLRLSIPEALAWVRGLRDRFAADAARSTKALGRRLVRGRARFLGPGRVRVGVLDVVAKRVILATGSRPVVPPEFLAMGRRVITSDSLFDLADLPARVGVVGLGAVGLEIGQALSRLGCDVIAFDRSSGLGGLTDPAVNAYAARRFAREFRLRLNTDVTLKASARGIAVVSRGRAYERDLVLASLGRRPNLDSIGLETIGVELDERGLPRFEAATMKLAGAPVFLAGDVGARRAVLHEAADDGRIAGRNSVRREVRRFDRRAPLAITFSEPGLALIGRTFAELRGGRFVTGESSFEADGRALILGMNCGLLHVYARPADGRFLGAEMIGPGAEHLAHLMAWSLQQGLSVFEMLRMPFYHPVVEETLRAALRDAAKKVRRGLSITTLSSQHYSE